MRTLVQVERRGGDIADPADVATLVRRFYLTVIPDPLLGPVFRDAGVDWSTHIPLLRTFWERELLGVPGYAGNVAAAHGRALAVPGFGEAHLRRWLELFDETVDERFSGPTAERAKQRAAEVGATVATQIRRAEGR